MVKVTSTSNLNRCGMPSGIDAIAWAGPTDKETPSGAVLSVIAGVSGAYPGGGSEPVLREYYDTHDTSAEMEPGHWAEPHPMATTSLRLPVEVIDQLKQQAQERHLRYTSYVRSILEGAARGGTSPEIADITERLERIERAVTERQKPGDQKTA